MAPITVTVNGTSQPVDSGLIINLRIVEQQIESGAIVRLTTPLQGEITLEGGRVQEASLDDYPLPRMGEVPAIETHILPSERPPGIGEMSVPLIAPAVANAVFTVTGKRIRRSPIRAEALPGS
jgi:isoquinoline 1-oxidoreductase beta subunit